MAYDVSRGTVYADKTPTPRELRQRFAETVNVKDFGARGDGATNDTVAITAAIAAATAPNGPGRVFIPAGTYLIDPSTFNGAKSGLSVIGAGQLSTVLKSRTGGHVVEVTGGGYVTRIELGNFTVLGNGGTGHGIYFHDNGPYGGPSHLLIHDVFISSTGGAGLRMTEEWNTAITNVSVTSAGTNAFDIQGGNTTVLTRCYAQTVAANMVGFRIHGSATLIACNGIDGAASGTAWGVFGDSLGEDGQDSYSSVTLLSCNVEDFGALGLRTKIGSRMDVFSTAFTAPASGTVKAVLADFVQFPGIWSSTNRIATKGAAWANNQPFHASGVSPPFVAFTASTVPLAYYDDTDAVLLDIPSLYPQYDSYGHMGLGVNRWSPKVELATWTSPTFGAFVSVDSEDGNGVDINATTNVNFTIGNPLHVPTARQPLTITVRNTSGGALGAVTWGSAYRLAAWTSPANGFSRSIAFVFNGTNWIEVSRTPADVPN